MPSTPGTNTLGFVFGRGLPITGQLLFSGQQPLLSHYHWNVTTFDQTIKTNLPLALAETTALAHSSRTKLGKSRGDSNMPKWKVTVQCFSGTETLNYSSQAFWIFFNGQNDLVTCDRIEFIIDYTEV